MNLKLEGKGLGHIYLNELLCNYILEILCWKCILVVSRALDLKLDLKMDPYWAVNGNFVIGSTKLLGSHWAIGQLHRLRLWTLIFLSFFSQTSLFFMCLIKYISTLIFIYFKLACILQLTECQLNAIRQLYFLIAYKIMSHLIDDILDLVKCDVYKNMPLYYT